MTDRLPAADLANMVAALRAEQAEMANAGEKSPAVDSGSEDV
jgi:hypothetical protein